MVATLLVAVLVAQVHFHSRNVMTESDELILNDPSDLSRQLFTAFDVMVCIDLNQHSVSPFVIIVLMYRLRRHQLGSNPMDPPPVCAR